MLKKKFKLKKKLLILPETSKRKLRKSGTAPNFHNNNSYIITPKQKKPRLLGKKQQLTSHRKLSQLF
jgi:hypothetical protein